MGITILGFTISPWKATKKDAIAAIGVLDDESAEQVKDGLDYIDKAKLCEEELMVYE